LPAPCWTPFEHRLIARHTTGFTMDFSLDDDDLALRDAVQRFCDGEYPAPTRGDAETDALAMQRRKAMAQLGLLGLTFDVDHGGSQQGAVHVMLVAQELGRALAGGVFVASTVMAGQLLAKLGTPQQTARWLPALATGDSLAALAVYEDGSRYAWHVTQTQAVATPQGYLLNGRKTLVLRGDSADLLLLVARTSGATSSREGLTVFAVEANAPGVQLQPFDTLDGRRAAHITFTNVAVGQDRVLGAQGGIGTAADAVEAALDAGNAALCAEAVGAVQALLAQTAEHLRTRRQFGAPLAKFQVLQHRSADMAIALEQIKSMACAAAMAVEEGSPQQRRRLVSAAKVLVSQQGRKLALDAIQMHGAMGMTQECRISHYARRLLVIGQELGDAAWHLERMGAASTSRQHGLRVEPAMTALGVIPDLIRDPCLE
jgi:alkylation response protein AidB-like acyl-CoA dehydrogenase